MAKQDDRSVLWVRQLTLLVALSSATVALGGDPPPPVQPKPLPSPIHGARVFSAGGIVKNASLVPAEDVRVGFRIPGFGENINQVSLGLGYSGISQFLQFGNELSSSFDKHFLLDASVPTGEYLTISCLIDSEKSNHLKWNRKSVKLTDANQNEIPTLFYDGSIHVEQHSPLVYTFGNDSDVPLFVSKITLGRSPDLVSVENISMGSLANLNVFDNGGAGWLLAPDETIDLTPSFRLAPGEFVVSEASAVGDPGGDNELSLTLYAEHEQPVPESATLVALSVAALGLSRRGHRRV